MDRKVVAYKVPKNIKRASKLLLKYVIHNSGGQSAVALKCKISRQLVKTFLDYGYVPLTRVYDVSKNLGINLYVLSYSRLMEVFGEKIIAFSLLLEGLPLTDVQKEHVLNVFNKKAN